MTRVLLTHPSSLEHETGRHPERPARMVATLQELEREGWLGFERALSPAVDRQVLPAVHPEPYVDAIERVSASGGGPWL